MQYFGHTVATAAASQFWAQFWPNFVATIIGAGVGVWLALLADHARGQRARAGQESALLRAARDAVQANLTLCAQLKIIIGQNLALPTFETDVGLLDAVLPRLVELSLDTKLLAELSSFRYQLHHVNRKLDHMLEVSRLLNPADALTSVGGSILDTIAALEGSGQTTLPPLFNARITSLVKIARPWWKFWGG